VEVTDMDKDASLLRYGINYDTKKFYYAAKIERSVEEKSDI